MDATALKRGGLAVDILFDVLGSASIAVAIECFNAPNNIAPGGVSGVSILLNYLFGVPISLMSLLINIPLLVLAYMLLGRGFTLRTMKSVVILTAMLELAARLLPAYHGEPILAALYGGVFNGIGLSLVFMRSSTTGGTDIVARLIQRKLPGYSVGRILLLVDACVLVSAALVYRSIESALYAMISIFTSTRLIDSILYGLDEGRVLLIVSERFSEIAEMVGQSLQRGCTLLEGRGAFTGQDRPVLMCAVRKSQFYELKSLVHAVDPSAFIMAMEANEIIGEGFKDPSAER